ncbi:Pyridoxal-5'-phosphate-dependent protein beta subunit [Segniliparus rotundus DSM 44985]|uniref:Pyridoxal-5'-phosphate-dependent protein beta subunit n=1 Tax=Segniliparus rotundus (strain ATCC BAA-972 / CDC 1076 / CIP 108378 / DSM 44985 / JCM 13578) TaxID=640132 RepID=D6ZDJ2_SEGRD|nr:cysteine synthase family protein [Segniliparus rotundus]ADG97256.1 Pyridoxal-5'-phosphate-dependent protein beta subunit [Segniliparus rotundus DSM 44985]
MIVTQYSDLIGRTPLLEFVRLENGTRYLLKLEQCNPTGSMKIRMARQMVLDALADGRLPQGGRIVESTSGNTGLGLAVVAAELGLRFTAVVDHHAAVDKIRAMEAMGTELVYVAEDGDDSLNTAAREELAEAMAAADPEAFFTEQHNNDSNPAAYAALAQELLLDLPRVDYMICAVGTGGSLFGTARELARLGQRTQVIGVEPVGSIAFGGPGGDYWQSGTGTPEGAIIGTAVDYELLDEGVKVSDVDAFATARVIARRTGLLIGGSSGGCVHAALQKLPDLPDGSTVVSIVCDGGEKYLDTVFDEQWMAVRGLLDPDAEEAVGAMLDRLGVRSARSFGSMRPRAEAALL